MPVLLSVNGLSLGGFTDGICTQSFALPLIEWLRVETRSVPKQPLKNHNCSG